LSLNKNFYVRMLVYYDLFYTTPPFSKVIDLCFKTPDFKLVNWLQHFPVQKLSML